MSNLTRRAAVENARAMTEKLKELDTDIEMPYNQFKSSVLPLIANRGENFDVQQWIGITGHPNIGIRVVSDSGEKLYYIPPFLDSSDMRSNPNANLTVLANDLDNITSDSPRSRDSILYGVLKTFATKDSDMVVSAVESILHLNKIFRDHDMPLIEIDDSVRMTYEKITGKTVSAIPKQSDTVADDKGNDDIFSDEYDLP